MKRLVLFAAIVSGWLVPADALAHAQLVATSPKAGAVLQRAPTTVSFRFGETVGGAPDSVRIYDTSGARVDEGDARHVAGDSHTYGVNLKPHLAKGTYTATYRIVSADTHVVTGGLSFSIGAPGTAGSASLARLLAGQQAGPVTSTAFTAARALQYAAIAVGVGAVAFLVLVWLPALNGLRSAASANKVALARAGTLVTAAAVAGVVSAVGAIILEAAESAGLSFWSAARDAPMRHVLGTRFGIVWLTAGLLWIVALVAGQAVLHGTPSRARLARLGLPLGGLIALPALAGHASVERPVWLFLPTNIIHITAMTIWLGGLVALLFVVPSATRQLSAGARTTLLARSVGRFSPLALGCVIALVVTGIAQSLVEINAWAEILHTAYGRAVLIKVALLLVLIGLGALNRQRSVPRVKQPATAGAAVAVLRRALRAEVVVIAGVIIVSGALSEYTPAKDAYTPVTTVAAQLGPSKLHMTLAPAKVGVNELNLYLDDAMSAGHDSTMAPARPTDKMTVEATLPAKGIGPIAMEAMKAGPGHYMVDAATLGAPGNWTFDVVHRISDFDEYEQRVQVDVH